MKEIYSKKGKNKLRKLILFAIPILFIGTTLAKYSSNTNQGVVFEAKNFYFESDLLKDLTEPVSYKYQTGIDTISILLKNNIDDYRYSDVETNYEVTITDIDGNSVNDKNGDIVKKQTGKLSNTNIEAKQIQFTNLPSGIYVVTANATKPYHKSIQGTFTLIEKDESISYEVSDSVNSPVLYLTIISKDYSGEVTINWPDGVVPNSTDSNFKNIDTGFVASSTNISFNANSEYKIQFFKSNPNSVYTTEQFSVERSNI